MQEGTSLVWRKTLISMQEGRGRQGKAVTRLKNNIIYYFRAKFEVLLQKQKSLEIKLFYRKLKAESEEIR